MLSRITMGSEGLAFYLRHGKRKDSSYTRIEKDNVLPLFGSLNVFENAEKECINKKVWENNYEHITVGFSKEDMKRLENLIELEKNEVLQDIAKAYIKHRTSGYDLDNEVIAYAELHEPKVKVENGKERLSHIHIAISYLNSLDGTKIQTTFYNNSYISDTIDKYLARKHHLTFVSETKDKKRLNNTQKNLFRNQLIRDLDHIETREDLVNYFEHNELKFKEIKTKKNNYFKVINKKGNNINLRGNGFHHISKITGEHYLKQLNVKSKNELKEILDSYYIKRKEMVAKRRSIKTTKTLNKLKKEEKEMNKNTDKRNSIKPMLEQSRKVNHNKKKEDEVKKLNATFQQLEMYKKYGYIFDANQLDGYFIDSKNETITIIKNLKKDVNITDKGNELTSNSNSTNLEEEVKLMLDLAIAKEWNLTQLDVEGTKEFRNEINKQIVERLKLKEKPIDEEQKRLFDEATKRPTSTLEKEKQNLINKQNTDEAFNNEEIKEIKEKLDVKKVLTYANEVYKINLEDYEITSDNLINNKGNKQKPKNVIDFFQKEIHLTTKEAIEICKNLYKTRDKISNNKKEKALEKIRENHQEYLNKTASSESRKNELDKIRNEHQEHLEEVSNQKQNNDIKSNNTTTKQQIKKNRK